MSKRSFIAKTLLAVGVIVIALWVFILAYESQLASIDW